VLSLGEARIVHPGSTVRTSFAEGPLPKGVALWTWGRAVDSRFVDLPERRLVAVRGEGDLPRVGPGTLVRLERSASLTLAAAALESGGWLAGAWPAGVETLGHRAAGRAAQIELFGA
jgi:hypothetical protein